MTSIIVTIEQDVEGAINWVKTELSSAAKAALSIVVKDSAVAITALKQTTLGTDLLNLVSNGHSVAASSGSAFSIETLIADAEKLYADFEAGGGLVGVWETGISIAQALLTSVYNDFVNVLPKSV